MSSVQLHLVPALEHDVIQRGGAALGGLHPVSVLNLVEDLGICHAWKKLNVSIMRNDHQQLTRIGNAAVGHQFSQEDAEAPDVALDAEPAEFDSFGCGPPDGEPGADPGFVLFLLDQPRQPEVSDLHDIVVTHQNISRRKVPENLRFNKILKTVMFTYL